jgi:glycolate oxidase FAD binding subunit
MMLAPTAEAELADIVRAAHDAGETLRISGNDTKSAFLRPVQAARDLSTRNLTGITLYAPNELILSARAGTPMAEIEAAVAAEGQYVIAEPPDFSALLGNSSPQTIGGVVATNLSGPRRIAWGATRDHVMGLRAVNGSGEVIHSGGRVLKNVTGLDLCKLLSGSHGTLAVITEVTLKVLPAPPAVGTLVLPGLTAEAGVAALSAALGSPYSVSGAAWLPGEAVAQVPELARFEGSLAMIRVEEVASSVSYRLARLREELSTGEVLDDAASRAAWQAVRNVVPLAAAENEAIWRISVRPSAGPGVLRAIASCGGRGFLDWGGGLVWATAPAQEASHHAVREAALAARGTWALLRAPLALRASLDVIPPEPPALAQITRGVKAALDPKFILNPGRMYAGL